MITGGRARVGARGAAGVGRPTGAARSRRIRPAARPGRI